MKLLARCEWFQIEFPAHDAPRDHFDTPILTFAEDEEIITEEMYLTSNQEIILGFTLNRSLTGLGTGIFSVI